MTLNYVTPEGRAFFNSFKNSDSVRKLADPPKNMPLEHVIESPVLKKMLQSWMAVNPNKEILLPSSFVKYFVTNKFLYRADFLTLHYTTPFL